MRTCLLEQGIVDCVDYAFPEYLSAPALSVSIKTLYKIVMLVGITCGCSSSVGLGPSLPITEPTRITTGLIAALENVEEGLGTRQDVDGLVFCLVRREYSDARLSGPYYSIGGAFYDQKYNSGGINGAAIFENRIPAGTLQFNALAFDYNTGRELNMYLGQFRSLEETQLHRFDSVLITVEGEPTYGVPSMQVHANFYQEIDFEESVVLLDSVSPLSALTLRWNRDSSNVHGVVVHVTGLSPIDGNTESSSRWIQSTEDDGEFVVPQHVLEDFSKTTIGKSGVRVSVSRGNGEVLEYESKRYLIIGGSTVSNRFYWN